MEHDFEEGNNWTGDRFDLNFEVAVPFVGKDFEEGNNWTGDRFDDRLNFEVPVPFMVGKDF